MQYISTRGISKKGEEKSFKQATLEGLAEDGGLFVPYKFPKFNKKKLDSMKTMNYAELSAEVISEFTGKDLNKSEIFKIASKAYRNFVGDDAATLLELRKNKFILELFHGPTLAFKDFALQLLGGIFDKFLYDENKSITILGATSGDTGSAAIEAFKNKKNVRLFILHPQGRVSDFQRKQMTTVDSKNVYNIAIKGNFDDCQAIVKALFKDLSFNKQFNLASINSLNWARVLAQVVYYFYAVFKISNAHNNIKVNFSVPTGNFGDAYAGFIAKKIGLPINKILVATNSNDILANFFQTGIYKTSNVVPTLSPSMDIQVASNFERLLYEICKYDCNAVSAYMEQLSSQGYIKIKKDELNSIKNIFMGFSINDKQTLKIIRDIYENEKIIVDPHTAVGLGALEIKNIDNIPLVSLATAHPIKFKNAVERALDISPKVPRKFMRLFDLEEKFYTLDNQPSSLKALVKSIGGQ